MRGQVFQKQPKLGLENVFVPSCTPDEKKEQDYINHDCTKRSVRFIIGTHCVMKRKINNQRC